jgi:hypothetical protein
MLFYNGVRCSNNKNATQIVTAAPLDVLGCWGERRLTEDCAGGSHGGGEKVARINMKKRI